MKLLDIPLSQCQKKGMDNQSITFEKMPQLKDPILVAGFDGWGNALDVSKTTVSYLIRNLKAERFAEINPDLFYRYDSARPMVHIEGGTLEDISPPGGAFYSAEMDPKGKSIVILKADEPHLKWQLFTGELLALCEKLGIRTIITVGSMYDDVLHSDRIMSGIASTETLYKKLIEKDIIPISYKGPSGIHSTIHAEGQKKGIHCISLWSHCPYYLQGTTHYGLCSSMVSLLAFLGNFDLDTEELDKRWREINQQIQEVIANSAELQAMVNEIRKAQVKGSWASMKASEKTDGKVIDLRRFMKPR